MQADIAATCPRLHLRVEYLNEFFEVAYPRIKGLLEQGRYKNVLFNLDQCGDSHVNRETIIDIMRSYASAEIFYTFMISSLLAFLKKDQPDQLTKRLDYLGIKGTDITSRNDLMSKNDWLGTAEDGLRGLPSMCAICEPVLDQQS